MKKIHLLANVLIVIIFLQSCGGGKNANSNTNATTGIQGSADFYDYIVEIDSNYNKIITWNSEVDKSATAQLVNKYSDSIILKNAFVSSIKNIEQQRDETYDPNKKDNRKVKYIIELDPYKIIENDTVVISRVQAKGFNDPVGKQLAHTPCQILINVYDEVLDGIYPPFGFQLARDEDKGVYGKSYLYCMTELSAKVKLKDIQQRNASITTKVFEDVITFDLISITDKKDVMTASRKEVEATYSIDYKKLPFSSFSVDLDYPKSEAAHLVSKKNSSDTTKSDIIKMSDSTKSN